MLHRTTGNRRFHFTHGIHVYVFCRSGDWWAHVYLDNRHEHGGTDHGPTLNQYLNRFVDLELVSMGDRL